MDIEKPIWEPSAERIERANLSRFMRFVREQTGNDDLRRHAPLYDFSIRQPERFWSLLWEFCGVRASGNFEPVLIDADRMPGAKWFPGVKLNFAQNLLRYRDERAALVFRNEWGHARELSYAELHQQVGRLAHALRAAGVVAGDRVAGFMPNIPETVIAMLAATSLGAVWSSCSPDFGINGVVDRFGQIAPKVLFTADAYPYGGKRFDCLEKIRGVLSQIPSVEKLVVVPYSGATLKLAVLTKEVDRLTERLARFVEVALTMLEVAEDHPPAWCLRVEMRERLARENGLAGLARASRPADPVRELFDACVVHDGCTQCRRRAREGSSGQNQAH